MKDEIERKFLRLELCSIYMATDLIDEISHYARVDFFFNKPKKTIMHNQVFWTDEISDRIGTLYLYKSNMIASSLYATKETPRTKKMIISKDPIPGSIVSFKLVRVSRLFWKDGVKCLKFNNGGYIDSWNLKNYTNVALDKLSGFNFVNIV